MSLLNRLIKFLYFCKFASVGWLSLSLSNFDHIINTEQPVLLGFNTDKRGNAPTGPVGHYVILAGRGEMVDRPDLVGPHNSTEQSVFLGLDVDQVEHVSANIVHPGA